VSGVSFTVHKIMASIVDDEERWATILTPPEGKSRWAPDEANRRVGRQVVKPVTPQEKITAIHTLARDEDVAAAVTTDLLKTSDGRGETARAGGSPGRGGVHPRRVGGDHRRDQPAPQAGRRFQGDG
jgi:hypothetical protein